MLQNLSKDIRECYLHAEECKRFAETARTPSTKGDYLAIALGRNGGSRDPARSTSLWNATLGRGSR